MKLFRRIQQLIQNYQKPNYVKLYSYFFGPLLKTDLPLMNFKNVLKPLAKGKEREIYDTSGLAKKIHYDMKILDIEKKYFTTLDYNL